MAGRKAACGLKLGGFSPAWIGVDVGDHAAIENCFAVLPAIIDAIQADDGPLEVKANRMGEACHLGKASRNRQFIAIAGRSTNGAITLQLRSHKATILSPFIFLWPLNPMLSPPFFAAVVVPPHE